MAWDSTNDDFMPGWDESAGTITVPLAAFPQLDDLSAAGTADARGGIFGIVEQWFSVWSQLSAEDRAKMMNIVRSQSIQQDNTIVRTFTFTFRVAPTGLEVLDEPA